MRPFIQLLVPLMLFGSLVAWNKHPMSCATRVLSQVTSPDGRWVAQQISSRCERNDKGNLEIWLIDVEDANVLTRLGKLEATDRPGQLTWVSARELQFLHTANERMEIESRARGVRLVLAQDM